MIISRVETVTPLESTPFKMITIGSVTGVSIAALFTGGLLPGLVLAATLVAVVWVRYRKEDLSGVQRANKRQIGRAFMVEIGRAHV